MKEIQRSLYLLIACRFCVSLDVSDPNKDAIQNVIAELCRGLNRTSKVRLYQLIPSPISPAECHLTFHSNLRLIDIYFNTEENTTPFQILKERLLRINDACRTKCIMLCKKKSLIEGDLPPSKRHKKLNSKTPSTTAMNTQSDFSGALIKFGVITAIVSIIAALCAMLTVAIHKCHSKTESCNSSKDSNDVNPISDTKIDVDIPSQNVHETFPSASYSMRMS